ncbi:MAG: NADH-quinone oxidoreductase subunit N [Deltaproteobacteria bacterium]|nr:NADH-quinone oxidoreductase subunit N [Deltaproteobacteria bacterium]
MIPSMDFGLMVPELLLIAAGIVVLLADAFLPREAGKDDPRGDVNDPRGINLGITLVGLLAAGAFIAFGRGDVTGAQETFEGLFIVDRFGDAFKMVALLGTILGVLLSDGWLRNQRLPTGAFYALILFATTGMLYLLSATDMVMVFVGLELMSIPLYCLAAALRWEDRSVEAGVKYLVLGSFATAVMLMGFALLYGFVGIYTGEATTRLDAVVTAVNAASAAGELPGFALLGGVLAMIGLLFKMSAVPFHMWTPDVYEGSPTSITAWMSVSVKAVTAAVLLRIFGGEVLDALHLEGILWVVAALTMFLGNTMALTQDNVKRMLAYSSVAHGGYMLVGVLAASSAGSAAVLFYAAAYTFGNMAAFAVLIYLSRVGYEVETFDDLKGLGTKMPLVGAVMGISMLSLMGIPPLAGFFGKFAIFRAAVTEGYVWLTVIGLLTSAISVAYYLRPIVVMFMSDAPAGTAKATGQAWTVRVALVAAVLVTVGLGLMPGGTLDWALESAQALVAGR